MSIERATLENNYSRRQWTFIDQCLARIACAERRRARDTSHLGAAQKQLQQVYGGEKADALPARGALGSRIRAMVEANKLEVVSPFFISEAKRAGDAFDVKCMLDGEDAVISGVHEIVSNTGSRPDTSFLREIRAAFDPVLESVPDLAPLIDPNIHSCGSVRPHCEPELRQPEKDFYVVGLKSYGRAPTFLMATG